MCPALLVAGVALGTALICVTVMSGLQAAPNLGGQDVKVDGSGEDLPRCVSQWLLEGP